MHLSSDAGLTRVAAELRAAHGQYVSGERLAQALGLSRNAVWKHVGALRRLGYQVESSRRLGHRLTSVSDRPFPWEIAARLQTRSIGRAYRFYEKVASTQDIARAWAAEGAPDGAVVLAEEQCAGRGRKASSFVAPRGGLWCSVILRPHRPAAEASLLSMLGAVAAATTLRRLGAIDVRLWWPKDILIGTRKVGGALAEVTADQDEIREAVIGIGLNINVRPEAFPATLRDRAGSLLMALGREVPLADAVAVLFEELHTLADAYRTVGPRAVVDAWRRFPYGEGERVRLLGPEGERHGVLLGLTDSGAVLLASDHEETVVPSGVLLSAQER